MSRVSQLSKASWVRGRLFDDSFGAVYTLHYDVFKWSGNQQNRATQTSSRIPNG